MKFSTIATMFVAATMTLSGCNHSTSAYENTNPEDYLAFRNAIAKIPSQSKVPYFYGTNINQDNLQAYEHAIGQLESNNNYYAISSNGLGLNVGRFQIMEMRIPTITETYLGIRVQPWDYLANPTIQDLTFEAYTLAISANYPAIEDCAAIWYSGQPLYKSYYKRSTNGMPVLRYVGHVLARM